MADIIKVEHLSYVYNPGLPTAVTALDDVSLSIEGGEIFGIIGFSGDLYGQVIKVSLLDFIRDEQKFGSVEALSAQIALDAARAKEIFEKRGDSGNV